MALNRINEATKRSLSKENYDLFVAITTNFYSILSLQAELDKI
ncbi:MAG: hypothetical protein U0T83_06790 [Bacteriovoracaceae bacterium]